MRVLTVEELRQKLSEFDDSLPVVILREGKRHSFPVVAEDMKVTSYCYFSEDEPEILRVAKAFYN